MTPITQRRVESNGGPEANGDRLRSDADLEAPASAVRTSETVTFTPQDAVCDSALLAPQGAPGEAVASERPPAVVIPLPDPTPTSLAHTESIV